MEIVNLRRARKAKARAEKVKQSTENRARHGTPKSERRLAKARSEKERRDLEVVKLDPDKPLEK
jgi:hypothetical protein